MTPALAKRVGDVLRYAGRIARERYTSGPAVRTKPDGSFVTDAEDDIEACLRQELWRLLPDAAWISEEGGASSERLTARHAWVVDPIDGTREFVSLIPEFAVSIGLVEDGRCILGAVFNPVTGEGGVGAAGGPLMFWGLPPAMAEAASLDEATASVSRSEVSDGVIAPFRDLVGDTRPLGSVAYKLLRVAAGVEHLTLCVQPRSEWDVCGGVGLLAAAGLAYERLDGVPVRFNQPDTRIRSGAVAGPCQLAAGLVARVGQRQRARLLTERIGRALRDMNTYLIEPDFHGFNLVRHGSRLVALAQLLGPVDLRRAAPDAIADWTRRCLWLEAGSLEDLRLRILDVGNPSTPRLVEEGYRGFNIVAYAGRYYAMALAVGPVSLTEIEPRRLDELIARRQCRLAESLDAARAAVDVVRGPRPVRQAG